MSSDRNGIPSGGWTLAAGAVGLLSAAVFSSLLHLERAAFVLAHGVVTGALATKWAAASRIHLAAELRTRPARSAMGMLLLSLILSWAVVDQTASEAPSGWRLVAALVWYGVVYGVVDAILLNVLPVLSARDRPHGLRRAALALGGSLFVTALYHLGFAEFRGSALAQPLIGNGIITAGYILTGNPLTAVGAHVAMHCAAVLHGMETTAQLPPHY